MKKEKDKNKKNNVLYYTGIGASFGTFVGTTIGIFKVEQLGIFMLLGIAFGALIGGIYGQNKVKNNSNDSSKDNKE